MLAAAGELESMTDQQRQACAGTLRHVRNCITLHNLEVWEEVSTPPIIASTCRLCCPAS